MSSFQRMQLSSCQRTGCRPSKEAVVVHESDEESTPELEEVKEKKDVEKSKEEEDEKELEVAPGTGESGACSLEATCESPTDCDLNSDRGSEEGGVSTDEGIVGSDEDDKEEKSDDLEKAKKSTEAEKSEVISESS